MERTKIYTIQNDKRKIKPILRKIDKNATNIIYSNCLTSIELGDRNINIIYDTILYSDKDNVLVLLMKDGAITYNELKEMLNNNKIKYHEVIFDTKTDNLYFPKNTKDLFITDSNRTIKNAVNNSISKKNKTCRYFPNLEGYLKITYYNKHGKKEKLYEEEIYSVLDLSDKMILINKEKEIEDMINLLDIDNLNLEIKKSYNLPYSISQKDKNKVKVKTK